MGRIHVQSEQGYRTQINIGQHTVIVDETTQDGGTDAGPTPLDLMLGTLGGCIVVTCRAYAGRKGWPLTGVSVDLEMDRFNASEYAAYSGDARFVHEIRMDVRFEGDLTVEQRERLLDIAHKCPVHRVLENPVYFRELKDAPTTAAP